MSREVLAKLTREFYEKFAKEAQKDKLRRIEWSIAGLLFLELRHHHSELSVRESFGRFGDTDDAAWEMGLDGRPADPWVHTLYLVLQRVDNSELFTFRGHVEDVATCRGRAASAL
jgi:hypothetical protein